jgi:CheY-like chemotaxis protein
MATELGGSAIRIVVIDDDYEANSAMSRLLASSGFDVVGRAYDGLAGLTLIKATRPDIAILDIEMPALNGLEVARRVRNEVESPAYLIAVTGCVRDDSEFHAAGFDAHFQKPVDWTKLELLLADFSFARTAERLSASVAVD